MLPLQIFILSNELFLFQNTRTCIIIEINLFLLICYHKCILILYLTFLVIAQSFERQRSDAIK